MRTTVTLLIVLALLSLASTAHASSWAAFAQGFNSPDAPFDDNFWLNLYCPGVPAPFTYSTGFGTDPDWTAVTKLATQATQRLTDARTRYQGLTEKTALLYLAFDFAYRARQDAYECRHALADAGMFASQAAFAALTQVQNAKDALQDACPSYKSRDSTQAAALLSRHDKALDALARQTTAEPILDLAGSAHDAALLRHAWLDVSPKDTSKPAALAVGVLKDEGLLLHAWLATNDLHQAKKQLDESSKQKNEDWNELTLLANEDAKKSKENGLEEIDFALSQTTQPGSPLTTGNAETIGSRARQSRIWIDRYSNPTSPSTKDECLQLDLSAQGIAMLTEARTQLARATTDAYNALAATREENSRVLSELRKAFDGLAAQNAADAQRWNELHPGALEEKTQTTAGSIASQLSALTKTLQSRKAALESLAAAKNTLDLRVRVSTQSQNLARLATGARSDGTISSTDADAALALSRAAAQTPTDASRSAWMALDSQLQKAIDVIIERQNARFAKPAKDAAAQLALVRDYLSEADAQRAVANLDSLLSGDAQHAMDSAGTLTGTLGAVESAIVKGQEAAQKEALQELARHAQVRIVVADAPEPNAPQWVRTTVELTTFASAPASVRSATVPLPSTPRVPADATVETAENAEWAAGRFIALAPGNGRTHRLVVSYRTAAPAPTSTPTPSASPAPTLAADSEQVDEKVDAVSRHNVFLAASAKLEARGLSGDAQVLAAMADAPFKEGLEWVKEYADDQSQALNRACKPACDDDATAALGRLKLAGTTGSPALLADALVAKADLLAQSKQAADARAKTRADLLARATDGQQALNEASEKLERAFGSPDGDTKTSRAKNADADYTGASGALDAATKAITAAVRALPKLDEPEDATAVAQLQTALSQGEKAAAKSAAAAQTATSRATLELASANELQTLRGSKDTRSQLDSASEALGEGHALTAYLIASSAKNALQKQEPITPVTPPDKPLDAWLGVVGGGVILMGGAYVAYQRATDAKETPSTAATPPGAFGEDEQKQHGDSDDGFFGRAF